MTNTEVYKTVYKAIKSALKNGTGNKVSGHREFAALLPLPTIVTEDEAQLLCSMVSCSCSNKWGLEAFYQIPLNDKETLGVFVRNNITMVYESVKQENVARKFAPHLV